MSNAKKALPTQANHGYKDSMSTKKDTKHELLRDLIAKISPLTEIIREHNQTIKMVVDLARDVLDVEMDEEEILIPESEPEKPEPKKKRTSKPKTPRMYDKKDVWEQEPSVEILPKEPPPTNKPSIIKQAIINGNVAQLKGDGVIVEEIRDFVVKNAPTTAAKIRKSIEGASKTTINTLINILLQTGQLEERGSGSKKKIVAGPNFPKKREDYLKEEPKPAPTYREPEDTSETMKPELPERTHKTKYPSTEFVAPPPKPDISHLNLKMPQVHQTIIVVAPKEQVVAPPPKPDLSHLNFSPPSIPKQTQEASQGSGGELTFGQTEEGKRLFSTLPPAPTISTSVPSAPKIPELAKPVPPNIAPAPKIYPHERMSA